MIIKKIPLKIKLILLFSGKMTGFGIFMFLFSLVFLSLTVPSIDFKEKLFLENEIINTLGDISNLSETNTIVNDNRIYKYEFSYSINDSIYNGKSYGVKNDYKINDKVPIEYLSNDVTISRIVGSKNNSFSLDTLYPFLVFLPIMFIVGLIILTFTIIKNHKLLRLLNNGFIEMNSILVNIWSIPLIRINNHQRIKKIIFKLKSNENETNFTNYVINSEGLVENNQYKTIVNPVDTNELYVLHLLPKSFIKFYEKNYINEK